MQVTDKFIREMKEDIHQEYDHDEMYDTVRHGIDDMVIRDLISNVPNMDNAGLKNMIMDFISTKLNVLYHIMDIHETYNPYPLNTMSATHKIALDLLLQTTVTVVDDIRKLRYSTYMNTVEKIIYYIDFGKNETVLCRALFSQRAVVELQSLVPCDVNEYINSVDNQEEEFRRNVFTYNMNKRLATIPNDPTTGKFPIVVTQTPDLSIEAIERIDRAINFYSTDQEVLDILSKEGPHMTTWKDF